MAAKRSIFEEVGAGTTPQVAATGGIARAQRGSRGPIRVWLMILFLLVVIMIAVGGLTRLTDSGLSITEWKPVTGALPPLSAEDWQAEFDRYRAIPEYQLQNKGMTLEAFKTIYWWEWGHRQLGRVIGLVWALGFASLLIVGGLARALGFLVARGQVWAVGFQGLLEARRIPAGWTGRLLLPGLLGGLQGAVGWWMVSSGLTGTALDVASYRLALHLGLAFVILGLLAWYIFLIGRSEADLLQARRIREGRLFGLSTGLMHFAFLQILLGALVAGIDAGRAFPTWPDMNGQFFPADAFYVPGRPVWAAFFENAGLVQFIHRMSGYLLLAFGLVVWWRGRGSAHLATRRAFDMLGAMLVLQMGIGVATVLSAASPHVAITHQFGAVVLWVLILRARYLSQYPVAGSIRKGTA